MAHERKPCGFFQHKRHHASASDSHPVSSQSTIVSPTLYTMEESNQTHSNQTSNQEEPNPLSEDFQHLEIGSAADNNQDGQNDQVVTHTTNAEPNGEVRWRSQLKTAMESQRKTQSDKKRKQDTQSSTENSKKKKVGASPMGDLPAVPDVLSLIDTELINQAADIYARLWPVDVSKSESGNSAPREHDEYKVIDGKRYSKWIESGQKPRMCFYCFEPKSSVRAQDVWDEGTETSKRVKYHACGSCYEVIELKARLLAEARWKWKLRAQHREKMRQEERDGVAGGSGSSAVSDR
ncbi:hypothetical protein F4778DRAFT_60134 [Xylariomycetidae sp. FL2044]|nr:hypothetical protein F4778DRAFT_60134 [Xylariomycetidae sp. FL2044]